MATGSKDPSAQPAFNVLADLWGKAVAKLSGGPDIAPQPQQ
jgi:hypothetical protein